MLTATAELARIEVPFAGDHRVDVRVFDLDRIDDVDPALGLPEEHARAEKFVKDVDARRFLVRRAILRHLIGERTGRDPRELGSTPDDHGRPRIEGIEPLRFNTSNSRQYYAVALVDDVEPGIDIELLRDIPESPSLVRRILSEEHQARLGGMDGFDSEHLLRMWTRKEAILKAVGLGLSVDPTRVDVPCERDPRPDAVRLELGLEESVQELLLRDVVDPALPNGVFMALALAMCD